MGSGSPSPPRVLADWGKGAPLGARPKAGPLRRSGHGAVSLPLSLPLCREWLLAEMGWCDPARSRPGVRVRLDCRRRSTRQSGVPGRRRRCGFLRELPAALARARDAGGRMGRREDWRCGPAGPSVH